MASNNCEGPEPISLRALFVFKQFRLKVCFLLLSRFVLIHFHESLICLLFVGQRHINL